MATIEPGECGARECAKARYIYWGDSKSYFDYTISHNDLCHDGTFNGDTGGLSGGFKFGPEEKYKTCDCSTAQQYVLDYFNDHPELSTTLYSASSSGNFAASRTRPIPTICSGMVTSLWGTENSPICYDEFEAYVYAATPTSCAYRLGNTGTITTYGDHPEYECLPNTHLEDGYCVPNPGWAWCDDSHTSVCPHCYTLGCLEATGVSLYPQCYDVGTTFELCVQWKPYDPNCQPTSEMDYFDVPITYEGSLANNISGPDTIRIDIQDNSTGCITLTVDSSIAFGGTLSIIPTFVPLCDPNESSIVLEICTANGGGDPSYDPGYGPGTYMPNIEDCTSDKEYQDCCAYMPKDYLMWRNGIGVATAVPPYMKYFFINN